MKCCDCKYYDEWVGDYGTENECKLMGNCYFPPFYDEECIYIDDDYEKTDVYIRILLDDIL